MADSILLKILGEGVESWNRWRNKNSDFPNLFGVDLFGADLSGANFSGTNLREANLREANLMSADLRVADLSGADLYKANLSGAHLSRAYLYDVNFRVANLSGAHLREVDLCEADLSKVNLSRAHLFRADLSQADLNGADLSRADLSQADLSGADLSQADLSGACLREADLRGANLSGADLREADLREADLRGANLSRVHLVKAKLHSTDLRTTILIETNFGEAELIGCKVFGIPAWNLQTENSIQQDLIISDDETSLITVDSIEVAQFIYLLLNNEKIRSVIDTVTSKSVLILGRFTEERKAVLDVIRNELRRRNYVPILFDFEKPSNRDLTETVMTLAGMARFVIADLSDPNSIPHEAMSFGEKLLSVPIQAIFTETPDHKYSFPMYEHLRRYPHVLEIFGYRDKDHLIASLAESIIKPAEEKAEEMRPPKLW